MVYPKRIYFEIYVETSEVQIVANFLPFFYESERGKREHL